MNNNILRHSRITIALLFVSFMSFLLKFSAPAAEPLSETLQKGLFEQEANRNLPAAIEHYEAIIKAADEQRKIVATALYHLAECYRKMGKEEQANALYTRLRRDFSEHKDLIQRLAGRSPVADESLPHSHLIDEPIELFQNLVGAQRDVEFYRTLLQQLQQQARATLPFVLATAYPDEALGRLIYQLHQVEQDLASKSRDIGGDHPEMKEASTLRDKLREQINERLDGVLVGLESLQAVRKQVRDEMSQSLKEKSFEPVLQAEIMSGEMRILKRHLRQAQQDQVHYEALIKEVGRSDRAQLLKRLPALLPDSHLDRLIIERNSAEQQLQSLVLQYAERHPQVVRIKNILRIIQEQIDRKVEGMLAGVRVLAKSREATHAALSERYKELETKYQQLAKTLPSSTLVEKAEVADHLASLEQLLQNSPDLLNAPATNTLTFLQHAASKGDITLLQLLLNRGAHVDAHNGTGATPLHLAVENGHKKVTELLLEAGASVDLPKRNGGTPLHTAAANGYLELTELLLKRGASVNARNPVTGGTPLHEAALRGQAKEITLLLKHGADPDALSRDNESPLHLSIGNRHIQAALILIEAATNLNQRAKGETPLTSAVGLNLERVPEALIKKGADPNAVSWSGQQRTPLHNAVKWGNSTTVRALLAGGADVNGQDNLKRTALHYAAGAQFLGPVRTEGDDTSAPSLEISRILIEHQADPNIQDSQSDTPLHYAARRLPEIYKLLVEHGGNPNIPGYQGMRPTNIIENLKSLRTLPRRTRSTQTESNTPSLK